MINNSSYLSEISDDRYKGNIGTLLIAFVYLGSLFVIVEGSLIPYFYINLISAIVSGLLFFLLLFIPESPVHLLRHGQEKEAKENLKWLRNTQDEVIINRELEKLKRCFLQSSQSARKLTITEVINSQYYLKVLIIALILQTGIALSGIAVISGYTHDIVERVLGDTTAGKYAILLLLAQNFGSILIIFVCHMFNRKLCHVSCQAMCSMSLIMLGLLLITRDYYNLQVPGYLLIMLLCSFSFFQGFGIASVVYIILPEILSAECRNSFSSILMFLHFSLHFLTTKLYPVLVDQINIYGWAFIFSSYSAFIAIFCIMYLPESKSRNIQQIFSKLCRNESRQNHINSVRDCTIDKYITHL